MYTSIAFIGRTWSEYRHGFGDLFGEFWLGNDNIFLLTNQASYKLRVDLWDFNSTRRYAQYMYFTIGGERDRYRLSVLNHTGDVRDGLSMHNGQYFRYYGVLLKDTCTMWSLQFSQTIFVALVT